MPSLCEILINNEKLKFVKFGQIMTKLKNFEICGSWYRYYSYPLKHVQIIKILIPILKFAMERITKGGLPSWPPHVPHRGGGLAGVQFGGAVGGAELGEVRVRGLHQVGGDVLWGGCWGADGLWSWWPSSLPYLKKKKKKVRNWNIISGQQGARHSHLINLWSIEPRLVTRNHNYVWMRRFLLTLDTIDIYV